MTGSSTESGLHALFSRLELGIVEGRFSLVIFLDIQGAFNNVTYMALMRTMREAGLCEGLVRQIESILKHRRATAICAGLERSRLMCCGCPEGGVLPPCHGTSLWEDYLQRSPNPKFTYRPMRMTYFCSFRAKTWPNCMALLIAVWSLSVLSHWAADNNLNFSAEKSEAIVFTWKR